MTTRRRHEPVTPLPLLQERFWRLVREHAPDVFDDLAGLCATGPPSAAALLGWATRFGLVGADGLQPAWIYALTVETLRFWSLDTAALEARSLLPWRILAVWNTDTMPRPPMLLPDPDETPAAFRRRQREAVLEHGEDLVRRGLAVVDRGVSGDRLVALVKHNCLGVSWEAIADGAMIEERNLRREARVLADLLGLV